MACARYYNEYLRPTYKHICKARAFSWGVTLSQTTKEHRGDRASALVSRRYTCTVATHTYILTVCIIPRETRRRYHLNFNESCGCKCRSYSFRLHSCVTSISVDATVHVYAHTRIHAGCTRDRVTMREHAPSLVYICPCKILSSFAPHSSSPPRLSV